MISPIRRIVILGAGFGSVYAAMRLERLLGRRKDIEIVLISDQNYFLFTPMLPEVPSSSIEAKHIISPIRAFFRRVRFQNSEVQSIDLDQRVITTLHCPACRRSRQHFDYLVIGLGSTTNFFALPGVAEHALPMKTLSDAMVLRNHIIGLLEHADMEMDREVRRAMLTFVVAGGGFAGVETVGELRDFVQASHRYYPGIPRDEVKVVLVHSGPRILPEINERLAQYALRQLEGRNVEVLLNTRVAAAAADNVALTGGKIIPARTLIWTTGVTPNPLLSALPCPRNKRGQIIVDQHLETPGHPGVYAVGDCAEIRDPDTGAPFPPTAQHAIRQGKLAAENLAASIQEGRKAPFRYKPAGVLASLGRRTAVAEIFGLRFSGFFAWWLWRTIYLLKLPGVERKVRVALDWTLDLFFPRDIVLLKIFSKRAPSEVPIDAASGEIPEIQAASKR